MKTTQIRSITWLCVALCLLTFSLAVAKTNPITPNPETELTLNGTVEGTIVDLESGKALTNVLVRIEGCKKAAMTNQYGGFFLEEVPTGVCCMKVSKRGYQKVQNDIIIQDGALTKFTIKLQTSSS